MTLDELNQIDVNDPAAVKQLQTFQRSRGYYSGPVDGKWGDATIKGVTGLRGDLQAESANQRAGAEARASENSAGSQLARFGTKFGPYAVGVGTGVPAGRTMSKSFDAKDAAQGDTIARLARAKDVTPIIAEQTLNAENRKRAYRTGKQFLGPAALLATGEATRRYVAPQFDEKTREYVNLGANAEQAAGVSLGVKQLIDLSKRSSPIDPVDVARIQSRAAEARGDPYTVSSKSAATAAVETDKALEARMAGLRARTAADLRTEAKAAGLAVSGVKEDLVRRIAESQGSTASKAARLLPKASLLAPFAAGALAYDAESNEAEAAGASPAEARGRGAVAGPGLQASRLLCPMPSASCPSPRAPRPEPAPPAACCPMR